MATVVTWLQYATWDSVDYAPGDVGTVDDLDVSRLVRAHYVKVGTPPLPPVTYPDPLPQYLLDTELPAALAADPTVTAAAAAAAVTAVDARVAGLDIITGTDSRALRLYAVAGYALAWVDLDNRMALGIRQDGTVVVPKGEITLNAAALAVIAQAAVGRLDLPDWFTRYAWGVQDSVGHMSEIAIGGDGRVPASVLAAWTKRMPLPDQDLPEFYYDATTKADGAIPALADTGQAIFTFGNSPLVQSGGFLHHTPGAPTNAAGYVENTAALGNKITEFGIVARHHHANTSVALILPLTPWGIDPAHVAAAQAGIHYVQKGDGSHHCSTWTGSAESPMYFDTSMGVSLVDGTDKVTAFRIDRATSTLYVSPPVGSAFSVTHANIAALTSDRMVAELYQSDGTTGTPAEIKAFWADSLGKRTLLRSGADLVRTIRQALQTRSWITP